MGALAAGAAGIALHDVDLTGPAPRLSVYAVLPRANTYFKRRIAG